MKIVVLLCCVALAMLLHPIGSTTQSGPSFRTINIHQTDIGYSYFDSMAITSEEDFKTFLEEVSQQQSLTASLDAKRRGVARFSA